MNEAHPVVVVIDDDSASALKALTEYDWPGNVRELANVIERATITARAGAEPRERSTARTVPLTCWG